MCRPMPQLVGLLCHASVAATAAVVLPNWLVQGAAAPVGCLQRRGCAHCVHVLERGPLCPLRPPLPARALRRRPNGAIQPCRRRVGPPLAAQLPSGGLLHLPSRAASCTGWAGLSPASAPPLLRLRGNLKQKVGRRGWSTTKGWAARSRACKEQRRYMGGWDAN